MHLLERVLDVGGCDVEAVLGRELIAVAPEVLVPHAPPLGRVGRRAAGGDAVVRQAAVSTHQRMSVYRRCLRVTEPPVALARLQQMATRGCQHRGAASS